MTKNHSTKHFKAVYKNCLHISSHIKNFDITPSIKKLFKYFSFLHDIGRVDDNEDKLHSKRSLQYIIKNRENIDLTQDEMNILCEAVKNHNNKNYKPSNLLIKVMLDADKLDLYRLDMIVDTDYLHLKESICVDEILYERYKKSFN